MQTSPPIDMSYRRCIRRTEKFQRVDTKMESNCASSQAESDRSRNYLCFLIYSEEAYFNHMIGQVYEKFHNLNYDWRKNRGWPKEMNLTDMKLWKPWLKTIWKQSEESKWKKDRREKRRWSRHCIFAVARNPSPIPTRITVLFLLSYPIYQSPQPLCLTAKAIFPSQMYIISKTRIALKT